uniref:Uncharacterized protein n=1 Tax=Rhizophora mucronata TaxID=61149 RepID=A0A2P2J534_RHIMU
MAVSFCSISLSPLSLPCHCVSFPPRRLSKTRTQITSASSISSSPASSHMDLHGQKLLEFPFVSAPHRDMMVDLVSTVENRLGSQLLSCTLPPEAQHCQNETGTAQASLRIRSGQEPSLVITDFILNFSETPLLKLAALSILNSKLNFKDSCNYNSCPLLLNFIEI